MYAYMYILESIQLFKYLLIGYYNDMEKSYVLIPSYSGSHKGKHCSNLNCVAPTVGGMKLYKESFRRLNS